LLRDNPDLLLVLGGKKDALYEQHEKQVKQLGISDSVVFTGFVSELQLKWLFQNCKVYVFPSLSEGFGLPGLEAMMHRAPVAASEATCLPEVYGDAAQYFNPLDPYDMARTINELLTNKRLRTQMIIAGHKQADKYSWARMAEQTLKVYEKALAAK
jgi:glycosyltransferase involved in cell wall biosynthesis